LFPKMNLNCLIFPAPKPNYFGDDDITQDGYLIFVPKEKIEGDPTEENKGTEMLVDK